MSDYNEKNENYYGSDLNRFIDENCSREMTCINIDCLLLKRSKKKIRIIESKHQNEPMPFSQQEALSRLHEILKMGDKKTDWSVDVYAVRGDPPYEYVEITEWAPNGKTYKLSKEDLKKWLEFENEIHELPNQLDSFETIGKQSTLSEFDYQELTR